MICKFKRLLSVLMTNCSRRTSKICIGRSSLRRAAFAVNGTIGPVQAVKLEPERLIRTFVQTNREKSAILEQLDSSKRRAEQNFERFPPARLAKGSTEAFRRVPKEANDWHS